ncbi:MAG: CoA-binding protein [Dehalococcoidales bacterium]|nr:CoA-binding protein [Dehalococcoidales bacterium]
MKVDFTKLDRAFNPRCVVVVGDNHRSDFRWLRSQSSFKGKLYSVQVAPEEIAGIEALGVKNYASIREVPEPVDLVIVSVPRAVAPAVLEDCITKDAAAAFFFTSGFAETDTEEGIRLERLLKERAEQANFHLIGPNCMGIFNPAVGIKQSRDQYTGPPGPVGFISQSGTMANNFSREMQFQGLGVSKSVSFGNGIVLDSADYLEYLGRDADTRIIAMYLEGVKDGRRFLKVLKEVAARKPVVILKGGRTEEGGRAIASHTGSLAVPRAIWDAAVKQCRAINVASMEELTDTVKALWFLSPVSGEKVAIAGGSGGQSVAIADVFAEAGLKVPLLTGQSYDELATFFSLIGGSYRNPVDTGNTNRKEIKRILEILERDANIDNLVLLVTVRFGTPDQIETHINAAIDIRRKTPKPVIAIISYSSSAEEVTQAGNVIHQFQEGGVPAFVALDRGAKALKNTLDYYVLRNGAGY